MSARIPFTLPLLMFASGCAGGGPATPPATFEAQLLKAAAEYESYGRFDAKMRFAPFYCAAPVFRPEEDRTPRLAVSASGDPATHGDKLYALFVKKLESDWPFYTPRPSVPTAPVGQEIVKEAWHAREVPAGTKPGPVVRQVQLRVGDELLEGTDRYLPYADRGGTRHVAGEKSALFIMLKLDPATPGTDQGWVYGTVSADGRTVTSAGRVESCMSCHIKAPHDRLFGVGKE